jgi:DNA-binding CsgD family transcriptional regulator
MKNFIIVLIGVFILTLGGYKKDMDKKALFQLISWNAIMTGFLSTFIILILKISEIKDIGNFMLQVLQLSLPLFYGFLISLVFKERKPTVLKEENPLDADVINDVSISTQDEIQTFLREKELTRREVEIVFLMKNGLTNKEIAEDLFIAESTVKKHISHIFEKLQVGSREELKYKLQNRRNFLD